MTGTPLFEKPEIAVPPKKSLTKRNLSRTVNGCTYHALPPDTLSGP